MTEKISYFEAVCIKKENYTFMGNYNKINGYANYIQKYSASLNK